MSDAEFGRAVMRIVSIDAAMSEQGWEALLSGWHAGVLAQAIGHGRRGYRRIVLSPAGEPVGPLAKAARERWRRLCATKGVDPDDAAAAAHILEELGLLVEHRWALVFRLMGIAEPMPSAVDHPALDPETRRAAAVAMQLFRVRGRVGQLVDAGDGVHTAASMAALASEAGTDQATLRLLFAEGGGWHVTEGPDGVRLEQLTSEELQEMLDAVDEA